MLRRKQRDTPNPCFLVLCVSTGTAGVRSRASPRLVGSKWCPACSVLRPMWAFFFFCNFFMGTKIFEDWGREKDGVPLLRFCAQGIVSHHSVLTFIIFFNVCKPPHTCLILTEGPAKWSRPSLLTSIYRDALSCWEIWN